MTTIERLKKNPAPWSRPSTTHIGVTCRDAKGETVFIENENVVYLVNEFASIVDVLRDIKDDLEGALQCDEIDDAIAKIDKVLRGKSALWQPRRD
jgi:hypothetical protein